MKTKAKNNQTKNTKTNKTNKNNKQNKQKQQQHIAPVYITGGDTIRQLL